ncbi:MAG: holo-ACP synthase [Actinomycetota bacterium]
MIGIDVVSISRLGSAIDREPDLVGRIFTLREQSHCRNKPDGVASLAGILAAKEATMKALGLSSLPAWARRIEISHDGRGAPLARCAAGEVQLSISHDGGVAAAVAIRSPEVTR